MDLNTPAGRGPTEGPEQAAEAVAHGRRLVLMGQGYVGLPVAMQAVARGYSVVGFDVDEARVKRLNAGESYVEDIPDDVLPAGAGQRPLPGDDAGNGTAPASTWRSSPCPPRCGRACPT